MGGLKEKIVVGHCWGHLGREGGREGVERRGSFDKEIPMWNGGSG